MLNTFNNNKIIKTLIKNFCVFLLSIFLAILLPINAPKIPPKHIIIRVLYLKLGICVNKEYIKLDNCEKNITINDDKVVCLEDKE